MDAAQQQRILGYFLQEAQEHLATLYQAIPAMGQPLTDPEQVSDWFRAAHSIKGGAAMLGLDALQEMALGLENCLKILRDEGVGRQVCLSPEMVALFQQGVAALTGLVSHLEQEGSLPSEMGLQVVREYQPVFIQLEALLQILVQGEGVMAGWEATPADESVPEIPSEPEATESEELDLVELFASLDAQATAGEVVAAEAPVALANTTQELASLAELFSLAPEEGGTAFSGNEGVAIEGEQTVEDLGALAELFTLEEEGEATAEQEDLSFLDTGASAEAMALESLSQLEPLPESDESEFNFASFSPEAEQQLETTSSEFDFEESLTDIPTLDFGDESGGDLGEFSFESFTPPSELEAEQELETASSEFDFEESLGDIPTLDFGDESGGDLGEFSFESFTPPSELEAEQELETASSEFDFEESLGDIPALDFSEGTQETLGEFDFESFTPEAELEAEPQLETVNQFDFEENLTDIPTLDFGDESGGDLGEFSFESFTPPSELEAEQELETASGEFDFEESLGDIPALDFSEGTEGSLGEFDFESFTPQSELEAEQELETASGEFDFEESLGDVPALDFSEGTEGSLGEFDFESFTPGAELEAEQELETASSEFDFEETLGDVPALDFDGETEGNLSEFDFESFTPQSELAEEQQLETASEFDFEETLADIPTLDFSEGTEGSLGELSFDDVTLDTETLGELTFEDVPPIPEELTLTSSGLIGDVGSDLEAALSSFVGSEQEEPLPQPEADDLVASNALETSLESLDESLELTDLADLTALETDLGDDLDFSESALPDLTGDLQLPDLGDLELPVSGEAFALDSNDFGDLEQLLAAAPTDLTSLEETLAVTPGTTTPPAKAAESSPAAAEPRASGSTSAPVMDQTMRVPIRQLDNLSNLIGELVVSRNTLQEDQNQLRQFLENLLHQAHQLNDLSQRMQDLYERSLLEGALNASRGGGVGNFLNPGNGGSQHSTGAEFDALEMDRFTGFHTLSQEIAERVLRVRESAQDIGFMVEAFDEVVRSFQRITQGLQEGINNARMEPFSRVTDRLPRAVRNVALKCGKQVTLEIEGRETLVDKMILEKLTDPMTHLVNNAIVHGIGLPAQRVAAGQPPAGRIVIRAAYQGNQTVITVSDDGVGINPDRVKAKAIERGVIAPEQAATMSKQDIYQLLFMPGFSTKDQADEFAGRGVGLDVVRQNLAEIRGTVVVDSELGKGTTFTIRLPLTLSISKSLPCVVSHAQVAFPMDGVADVPVDVTQEMIHTGVDGKLTLDWQGQRIPLRPLNELLRYGRMIGRGSIFGTNTQEGVSVVVVQSLGRYVAFQVDQVLNEQEVVIKQLSGPVQKPLGIAGATILGDGRIMMIADILELVDLALGQMPPPSAPRWQGTMPAEVETTDEPTVLIVDDSIVVREMLTMTFSNKGYRVEQARDGQEAWEKLRDGLPCDLMFCDIEMPRMDGLELLSKVRRDATLKGLPIAMLTSRGAERHRQMAIQLGANAYFTKPYLEETLLDAARRLLEGESLVASNN
ncbi:response regulator [Gloeomargaritales cyanobacterium VI4D9]|nr:response regulator [Gloeomargaritales cyanobacterium VI4D9]